MRNIEFRGKDIETGKWKYGFYSQFHNRPLVNEPNIHQIFEPIQENSSPIILGNTSIGGLWFTINENTLGQFTGLEDNNGKKIYEGDILELYDKISKIHWLAVIKFGNPNGTYDWGYQLKLLKILEPTTIKECFWNTDILVWVEVPDVKCEVVGNIWDNPEIVEGL